MCGKTFSGAESLMAHVLTHREKTFSCSQCDEKFWELSFLQTHESTHKTKNDKEKRISMASKIITDSRPGRISKPLYGVYGLYGVKNEIKINKDNSPGILSNKKTKYEKTSKINNNYNPRKFRTR